MKGLTPNELVQITEFIQKHHAFGYVPEENQIRGHLGYCIKYIDACYDSRQGDYWAITFRGTGSIIFTTNHFGGFTEKPEDFPYATIFDWIMGFLNYEWEQGDRRYYFMSDKDEGKLETPSTDFDILVAYNADLEDGVNSQDMLDACNWLKNYRDKQEGITN